MSPTAMTRERKGYEGRGTREEGEDKNEGRGDESGRMLTHLLSTGRRSPFNFMNRGTAIIYLMPLVPRYTTIYIEWLGLGPWMEDANERGRKKDGHMRVFNAHEPRLGSCASCETSTRIDSVHKCVQARRNAADLYKQSDPHCRTCMQRGIFARFFVLTVSACLLALPLCPSVSHCSRSILFPIRTILIIGEITLLFIYTRIFVNLSLAKN